MMDYSCHCERSEAIQRPRARLDCFVVTLLAMTVGPAVSLRRHHLVADDDELHQIHPPKARGQRHVGGVAAGTHQDTADARMVVAGVERVPLAGEIDLEPAG